MEVAVKRKAKRRHLGANECEELGQSAQGSHTLTHPHTSDQRLSTRDPNRGLYPRTPIKRRKYASSGSPSMHQKTISSFYSVKAVISTSPRKSPQPTTSTSSIQKLTMIRTLQEEDDEDDDDDISLLAIPLDPVPDLEGYEEIDDQLLADCVMPETEAENAAWCDDISLSDWFPSSDPEATPEHQVDYLEGMTAEMFGNDDDFESCHARTEPEVEPLPDAHYGLLGSSKALFQPQGSIDDLPEEVLRQILCLLPAQDLYRSACLVCHHWKNIIQDAKFMPYKKRYYRYLMGEKDTVRDILMLLRNHSITANSQHSHHSMRRLVIAMAKHEAIEYVSPDTVLKCVQKHRLYPQAEASIRLRIPGIKNKGQSRMEGPNPYAAMAIILILSESVGDVQALVNLLTNCWSLSAVTEYLSHIATMFLAMERNHIPISNRLHYNIYYALHLLENQPFAVNSCESGGTQVYLTGEQQQILSHDIKRDHVVKIIAFAGTGKTYTLVKYAEQRPHLRFLYVAFNSSVASEASRRFPRNVDCKTVHSLAYKDVGRSYTFCKKLTANVKPFAINMVLPKGRKGFVRSKVVAMTLNTFMASTDPTINCQHVPPTFIAHNGSKMEIKDAQKRLFVQDAQMIWKKMQELNGKSMDAYCMTHDGYLKLWQMQNPKPCLSDQYDALFIDEAQDCTPVIMDVLMAQRCGKILVGDPHQQIYTFRGAVNALQLLEHTHVYYLTQSFRFGAEIAYVGATILKVCKKVDKILVGGNQKGGVCDDTAEKALEATRAGVSERPGRIAILSRCNVGVFSEAIQLLDANPHCCIHFIGDIQNIGLDKIMDLWTLLQQTGNQRTEFQKCKFIRDPIIRSFAKKSENGFYALKCYAQHTEDKELESKVNIVEKYRERIPEMVERLKRCHKSDFYQADFILGTVHKSKGLEFDTVMIGDDFVNFPSAVDHWQARCCFSSIPADEFNLLYVAATRAKTTLIITKNISRILEWAGDYPLTSLMPSSLTAANNSPACSFHNCDRSLKPESAFIICKRPMKYTYGNSNGGPLCERCVWSLIGSVASLMTDDVFSTTYIRHRLH